MKRRSEKDFHELDREIIVLKINKPKISQGEIARRLKAYRKRVGRVLGKNRQLIEERLAGTDGGSVLPDLSIYKLTTKSKFQRVILDTLLIIVRENIDVQIVVKSDLLNK